MNIVAIISEYNPFHTGHEYQIKRIREDFGDDTVIVAIMSGNFTQRAEPAIMDKLLRARSAVLSGVNLVLEIPFPYSASSAEFFAMAGVRIATEIGATHLSFGSESADLTLLTHIAENMAHKEYKDALSVSLKENKSMGYPALMESVYNDTFGVSLSGFFAPNNILALEYLKAIKRQGSHLLPHTVKRLGAGYSDTEISASQHQSASAIRSLAYSGIDISAYVPTPTSKAYHEAQERGEAPATANNLSSAILSFFRLNPPSDQTVFHEADNGLYNRLYKCSYEADTLSALITLADTKKFTSARIRRAILNSFFGVTSSNVKELPEYTQVLAMDNLGKAILKNVKEKADFTVITKPSSFEHASDTAKMQKALSDRADAVYQLAKPIPTPGNASIRMTPFVL